MDYYTEDRNNDLTGEVIAQESDTEKPEEKKPKKRFWGPFLLGVLLTVLVASVAVWFNRDMIHFVPAEKLQYYQDLDNACGKYYESVQLLSTDPLAEKPATEFTEDDIRRLVASINDPYAQYFSKEEYEEFLNSFMGNYVGVGIGIVDVDGAITIKSVFSNGSAAEAGIKMEDVIVKVDGVEPTSVEDAVSKITGEEGTTVTLTILRDGEEMDFTLERAELDQESVAYYELEDHKKVGYINIMSFVKQTDEDFKLAVKDLENKGCDKFIIDLRNNGGGLTDSSIKVADYLLPACTIMTDVLKDGTETVYSSEESSADIDYVVLVNENTASASEILTAAVQDNHGAKVIGTKTYGKGVTQSVHKFKDGSALKYTVSEYYRPNGDKVQGIGITPDIEAEAGDVMDAALEELGE
ncbi:MAG: S41 family peptidase [Mogibacterium sp.]|nr:S41 family peptidase [Mogibacterium sp.]